MIIAYTASEQAKVSAQLVELNMQDREDIIVINARNDNNPTGSKA
ncbi:MULTISPECIES: hypothetical protein [unclassified Mycolicibacterium]|nr:MULTISPECIES: hypothetical protein [unclassified Mycolicibacterium]